MQSLKHAIIVCHPCENSFTMAVARRYEEVARSLDQDVVLRDLYRLDFDAALSADERSGKISDDVQRELFLLAGSDVFVMVYPIWFGELPALMKGYIDRTFGAGRILGQSRDDGEQSLLRGKHFVSLTLSGGTRDWLSEEGVLNSLRNLFDRYLTGVFGLAGAFHYHFDGVQPGMSVDNGQLHLARVDDAVRHVMAQIARQHREST